MGGGGGFKLPLLLKQNQPIKLSQEYFNLQIGRMQISQLDLVLVCVYLLCMKDTLAKNKRIITVVGVKKLMDKHGSWVDVIKTRA